jgi:hypothetical protein
LQAASATEADEAVDEAALAVLQEAAEVDEVLLAAEVPLAAAQVVQEAAQKSSSYVPTPSSPNHTYFSAQIAPYEHTILNSERY